MKRRYENWLPEEREAFLASHMQEIDLLARCVVKNHPGPWGQMFVAEAPTIIWLRLSGYDRTRPFRPWCRQVLRNALRDGYRQMERDRRVFSGESPERDSVVPFGEIRRRGQVQTCYNAWLDLHDPFDAEDLDQIQDWRLPTRLTLLAFYGLTPKVPEPLWTRWTASWGLTPEFPDLTECSLRWRERVTDLAEQMGRRVNTVSKTLKRHSGKLRDLKFVQDCLLNAA